MLKLFEEYTYELTEDERNLSKVILRDLSGRTRQNPWKNVYGARGRKVIQYLRINGNFILSSSHGSWMIASREEKEQYIESFRQRIRSMQATVSELEKGL